jgi:LmbE family N-acetylglucosaminyl deacetylase
MKKLLLSFAHPDDESFAAGVTAAKYAKAGWDVRLIVATYGEAGKSGPYENISGRALGAVRKSELNEAAAILGISRVEPLGYEDGKLNQIESGELEDILHKKLLEYSPQVVITFGTNGISNHPDHIRMCYATTYAFQKYARDLSDSTEFMDKLKRSEAGVKKRHFLSQHKFALKQEAFIDAVDSRLVPKLYYAVLPTSEVEYFRKCKLVPGESFGKPFTGTEDEKVTTVIDGKSVVGKKSAALNAHVTQESPFKTWIKGTGASHAAREYYILRMVGISEYVMNSKDRISDRL